MKAGTVEVEIDVKTTFSGETPKKLAYQIARGHVMLLTQQLKDCQSLMNQLHEQKQLARERYGKAYNDFVKECGVEELPYEF